MEETQTAGSTFLPVAVCVGEGYVDLLLVTLHAYDLVLVHRSTKLRFEALTTALTASILSRHHNNGRERVAQALTLTSMVGVCILSPAACSKIGTPRDKEGLRRPQPRNYTIFELNNTTGTRKPSSFDSRLRMHTYGVCRNKHRIETREHTFLLDTQRGEE